MNKAENQTFAKLFKKYRLRSEIETLAEFGDLLAQEGLVYENSLFTHWQKGDRTPKDRKILLAMIYIFARRSGLRTVGEANVLLSTVAMRDLSTEEIADLDPVLDDKQAGSNKANEPSLVRVGHFLVQSMLRSRFAWIMLAFIAIEYAWFIKVNIFSLQDSFEAYILNWMYGFNALAGVIYVIFQITSKQKNTRKDTEVLKLIGTGLFGQWLGLQVWTYYNLNGIVVPYPSIADICYFGGVLVYIALAVRLLRRHAYLRAEAGVKVKYSYLLIPIITLIFFYSFFLRTFGFSFLRQITITLNLAYPLANAIPVVIITYIFAFSKKRIDRLITVRYLLLVFAFSFQFLADYIFVYTVQMKEFVNGGLADFFYATSYAVMGFALVGYDNLYCYSSLKVPEWLTVLESRLKSLKGQYKRVILNWALILHKLPQI